MLELAILGLLQEQPRHGYELKKRLSETLGSFWGISFGSLYPALRRLERSGAIEVVDGRSASAPTGGPRCPRPARSRARPRPRASAWSLHRPGAGPARPTASPRSARSSSSPLLTADDGGDDERLFSLKLAFCRFLDPQARLVFLERRRAELADRLAAARRTPRPGRPTATPAPSWSTAPGPPSATSSGSTS